MAAVVVTTDWFMLYGLVFEAFAAIVSALLAFFALKVYRLSGERKVGLLGAAFTFFAASYALQFILNLLILEKLDDDVSLMAKLQSVYALSQLAVNLYMLLMTAAMSLLVGITFDDRSIRSSFAVFAIAQVAVFMSQTPFLSFSVISSICLFLVAGHYVQAYWKKQAFPSLLTALAFTLLFLSSIHFLLPMENAPLTILCSGSEFLAYLLILVNFYLVLKR